MAAFLSNLFHQFLFQMGIAGAITTVIVIVETIRMPLPPLPSEIKEQERLERLRQEQAQEDSRP